MFTSIPKKFLFIAGLVLIVAMCFMIFRLGRDYLVDWDECIYAQYAKEMKISGNFLYNTWNKEINFEKPPLYALLQQPFLLAGVSEVTQRLPSIFFGVLIAVGVFVYSSIFISPTVALLTLPLLFISNIFVLISTHVTTDIGFAFFLLYGYFFWRYAKRNPKFIYLSGIFFACAELYKGFSVVFFLFAIALTTLFLPQKKKQLLQYLKLLLAFTMVILPWHIFMATRFGNSFIQEYFIDNLFIRTTSFLTPSKQHALVYGYFLAMDFFPWNIVLFSSGIIKKIPQEIKIIFLNFLVPLILFSIAKSRLASYILPIIPLFCILIAFYITKLTEKFPRIYYLVLILLTFHMIYTLSYRTNIVNSKRNYAPRYDMFEHMKSLSNKPIEYLVPSPYRDLSTLYKVTIPYHTRYGATPCISYYTDKKIHVYFVVDSFKKALLKKKNYFFIANTDKNLIKNKPIHIIYKNQSYTLFSF